MSVSLPTLADLTDPREWLEDVEGDTQLDWVKERNTEAVGRIGEPSDSPLYARLLDIMESNEKIPYIGRVLNGLYYNFWSHTLIVERRFLATSPTPTLSLTSPSRSLPRSIKLW